jgi:hydroxypyruvate isomerase
MGHEGVGMPRREFLATSVAATLASGALVSGQPGTEKPAAAPGAALKGRLKQSVCRWCYGGMSLEDLCRHASTMGIQSVELLGEKEWSVPMQFGMTCAVANGPTSIGVGWNRTENHDKFVKESERLLPLVKAAGIPNMIVFSGNRGGLSDADGIKNCITGLKRVTPLAESLGVTIVMELLNSKVDHKDYQCDRTPWGVEVVKGVGSDRFKLLYDIYHMQIMEGDVIRTIRDHGAHIAHYHTAGVPGRHELDETQELNYGAVCRAIVDSGFKGFLAQEFIPTRDAMTSLREAVRVCDV